jgi:ribosomal protein S18 acetylase RimI-like enzyme
MSDIRVEPLVPKMHEEASRLLARAFVANPLHVAVFGPDELAANETFFRTALRVLKGRALVALEGERIVALIHWVHSPRCQFSTGEKLRMAPGLMTSFGFGGMMRIETWLAAWSKHDPSTPHTHLGPIGVDPDAQGRHIGQRLMEEYCHDLDRTRAAGYLETDRPENVRFYRRFGFAMTDEIDVLGVRNYLMRRERRGWS